MARSNKYAAINFNEIYGPKKPTSSSSSASSPSQNTPLSSARTHGRMLILTRPSKPQTPHPTAPPIRTPPEKPPAPTASEPDSLSLRPLTRTATAAAAAAKDVKESLPPLTPPKLEPFVPPHLRPGFAGKEERPAPDVQREKQGFRPRDRGGDEEARPRSGGGYEGMRRGGSDPERNRPGSGGNRPSSSGWNGYYRSPPPPPPSHAHFDDRRV